jgi:hypothetical protein
VTTATLQRPAVTPALSRRCEVLVRLGGSPGGRACRIECGLKGSSLCVAVCSCGHEATRWACRQCAGLPGTCRPCWDGGHECPVTIARLGGQL